MGLSSPSTRAAFCSDAEHNPGSLQRAVTELSTAIMCHAGLITGLSAEYSSSSSPSSLHFTTQLQETLQWTEKTKPNSKTSFNITLERRFSNDSYYFFFLRILTDPLCSFINTHSLNQRKLADILNETSDFLPRVWLYGTIFNPIRFIRFRFECNVFSLFWHCVPSGMKWKWFRLLCKVFNSIF